MSKKKKKRFKIIYTFTTAYEYHVTGKSEEEVRNRFKDGRLPKEASVNTWSVPENEGIVDIEEIL